MAGELEIIDEVIAQHKVIRMNIQGVRGHMADFDALFSLQRAQSGWAQASVDKLINQKQQLREALGLVQNGLNRHFFWEEKALTPIYGEAFMKALVFVHNEIKQHVEKTISIADGLRLEGMSQPEILAEKSQLQEATNTLGQKVEQHANLEEQMLAMLRQAFVAEAAPPKTG